MPFSRGDVVLVLYPDSNLRTAKRRPALVVQADNLQSGLPQIILAMISSNLARAGHPSRVSILRSSAEGQQMGLRTDSVVMTDNLATVLEIEDRSNVLGHLADMRAVDGAVAAHARAVSDTRWTPPASAYGSCAGRSFHVRGKHKAGTDSATIFGHRQIGRIEQEGAGGRRDENGFRRRRFSRTLPAQPIDEQLGFSPTEPLYYRAWTARV